MNDDDEVTPEGRFIKTEGEVFEFRKLPFHNESPCPKRALKSPNTNLTGAFLKFHPILAQMASGYGAEASSERDRDSDTETALPFVTLYLVA